MEYLRSRGRAVITKRDLHGFAKYVELFTSSVVLAYRALIALSIANSNSYVLTDTFYLNL